MGPSPPLPPPSLRSVRPPAAQSSDKPKRPSVPLTGRHGAFLVELVTYNNHPFKNHWAFFVRGHGSPDCGVYLHAKGDVRMGFNLEVRRSFDFKYTRRPADRILLQWVDVRTLTRRRFSTTTTTYGMISQCADSKPVQ